MMCTLASFLPLLLHRAAFFRSFSSKYVSIFIFGVAEMCDICLFLLAFCVLRRLNGKKRFEIADSPIDSATNLI